MYDLAIIGGGPAGYSAAFEAARLHLKTVLFEAKHLGGTCLNEGCVPTKYLAHLAGVCASVKASGKDGLMVGEVGIDYARTKLGMDKLVFSLRDGLEQHLGREPIELVRERAYISSPEEILAGGKRYPTRNILIATGACAKKPFIEGAVSSDGLLKRQTMPSRLHILGGGAIAVEFADIFRRLGAEVAISIRSDRILRNWDREIAVSLMQSMKRKGIAIHRQCDFKNLDIEEGSVVLSALGRKANTEGLNREWVDIGPAGGIITDAYGRTKTAGIFAAGDVVEGSWQLAHTGMEEGRRVAGYLAGILPGKPAAVVRCLYMDPEVASVGMTEAEAAAQGIDAVSAKQNLYANARTRIATSERGFMKVVADRGSHKILGAQLMGERAGDIVAELALAVNCGLSIEELLASTRPHPSYCEAITDVLQTLRGKFNGI